MTIPVEFQNNFDMITLQEVLEITFVPNMWLWDTFFPNQPPSQTRFIQMDKQKWSRRLAVFVSPLLQGHPVKQQQYTTDVLETPYIKEKTVTNAFNLLKRPKGVHPFQQARSPRMQAMEQLAEDTAMLKNRVFRTIEQMCANVLLDGTLDLQGLGIDLQYDYRLPSDNVFTVANGKIPVAWSNTTSDIFGDIENAADLVRKNTGAIADITILGRNLLPFFRTNADVKELLDNRRIISGEFQNSIISKGVHYLGNIAEMDIYVYSEYFEDESGTIVDIWDADKSIVTSRSLLAGVEYGAIEDLEFAGQMAIDMFLKSWLEQDPSVQILLNQASPLAVHHQMDGVVTLRPLT